MPNRKLNAGNYSFGFNGQLTDSEWMGGQSVSFEFRTEDPRIGRFLSTDPLTAMTPWETPYAFAGNSPIANIDWLGLAKVDGDTEKGAGARAAQRLKDNPKSSLSKGLEVVVQETRIAGSAKIDKAPSQNSSTTATKEVAKEAVKKTVIKRVIGKAGGIAALPFTMDGSLTYPEKVKHATKSAMGYARAGLEHITLKYPDYNDDIIGEEGRKGHDYITLYRGVNVEHARYLESEKGLAIPNYILSFTNLWGYAPWSDNPATPEEHNSLKDATLKSPYTSWTTNKDVAINYAIRPQKSKGVMGLNQRHGVVLTIVVKRSEAIKSVKKDYDLTLMHKPNVTADEAEYLLKGVRVAHKVEKIDFDKATSN